MPENTPICKGMDFDSKSKSIEDNDDENNNEDFDMLTQIMKAFRHTGFQATNLGLAVEQIQQMRKWRLSHIPWKEGIDDSELIPVEIRERLRARIFLAYTSNQISCGQREVLRFLVQHKMVDCIVTTAGGIEEDLMKCFQPTFMGDFSLDGRELRKKGINRIGNLLVPNKNYCVFEDWMSPIIESMHQEQDKKCIEWAKAVAKTDLIENDDLPKKFVWTPSKVIRRLGKEINNEDSVLYWA